MRDTTRHQKRHNTTRHDTLHHTTPHHTTPHYTIPHHTTPHYTTPHHTTPHYTSPYLNEGAHVLKVTSPVMFVLVLASFDLLVVLSQDSISSTFSRPTSQHNRWRLKLRSPTVAFDNAHLSDRALERVWRLCVLEVKREGHRLWLSSR